MATARRDPYPWDMVCPLALTYAAERLCAGRDHALDPAHRGHRLRPLREGLAGHRQGAPRDRNRSGDLVRRGRRPGGGGLAGRGPATRERRGCDRDAAGEVATPARGARGEAAARHRGRGGAPGRRFHRIGRADGRGRRGEPLRGRGAADTSRGPTSTPRPRSWSWSTTRPRSTRRSSTWRPTRAPTGCASPTRCRSTRTAATGAGELPDQLPPRLDRLGLRDRAGAGRRGARRGRGRPGPGPRGSARGEESPDGEPSGDEAR